LKKRYSPTHHGGFENLVVPQAEKVQVEKPQIASTPIPVNNTHSLLPSAIFDVARTDNCGSERYNNVLSDLTSRLKDSFSQLPLGRIEALDISIMYVKPPGAKEIPQIGRDFGIVLSTYHRMHYIIMLMGRGCAPPILLTKAEEPLEGAVNSIPYKNTYYNYPDILYDAKTLRALLKIPCIKQYTPSHNYRRL
jgi:hypothetical protein